MNDRPCYFGWHEIIDCATNDDIEYFKKLLASIPDTIEFTLKYCKDARWDIVARLMDILNQKYQEKENE